MEVLSLCPFRAAGLVWQPRPSAFSLLVVCKGTFDLAPGVARLAEIQDYPNEEDNHWDDDPKRSLYSATDLVPSKPRADVLLVGHAFAPYGQEVESFVTRLVVSDVAKAVEVVSERVWTSEPHVRYGSRITKAPLRYERAGGGPGTWNPVGVPLDAAPDPFGMTPLPALQPPGFMLVRREQPIPPVGYGPIAPSWPARRERLGRHAGSLDPASWHVAPLPADLDPAYFNAAPDDQQLSEIRADERIELRNLHPDVPHLVTTLPGLKPRGFVEREGKPLEEVLLRCDTLWIDTDRQIVTLTWRGQVALADRDEAGRVLLAMESPGRTLSFLDIDRLRGRPAPSEPGDEEVDSGVEWIEPEESGVAHRPSGLGAAASNPGNPARAVTLVGFAAVEPAQIGAVAAQGAAGAPPSPGAPPPAGASTSPGAPPSLDASPPPGSPPMPLHLSASDAVPPGAVSSGAGALAGSGPARRFSSAPPAAGARFSSAPPDPDRELPTEERLARQAARDGVQILWLDDGADLVAARIGHGSAAGALLSPSRAPSPPRSLTAALDAAIGQDTRFEPPAVTLTGDMTLALAPLERLRALLTVAAVIDPGDERAASLRSKGERLLAGPSPEGASWLAGRIADDLEAALAARAGAPDSLAGARRSLAASRSYQRALVLGRRHVRAVLRDAGGANLAVYIAEEACVHLPLDDRFRARVLGELHPRVDATDPAPYALRAAAIARIVTLR